jgi:hypothetical protein
MCVDFIFMSYCKEGQYSYLKYCMSMFVWWFGCFFVIIIITKKIAAQNCSQFIGISKSAKYGVFTNQTIELFLEWIFWKIQNRFVDTLQRELKDEIKRMDILHTFLLYLQSNIIW